MPYRGYVRLEEYIRLSRKMYHLKNSDGVAVVWAGLFIFVFLGFAALAVDLAYMYFVKNELQVAADAAALAGAAAISDPFDTSQPQAGATAEAIASENFAGGGPAVINSMSFGLWNGSGYQVGAVPVNSIYVKTEKTGGVFFGGIFGFSSFTASADAIAARPPGPTTVLSLCANACVMNMPAVLPFKEQTPGEYVAWTELSEQHATDLGPNSDIAKYIKGELQPPDVCGDCIFTNNSHGTVVLGMLGEKFARSKDPDTLEWRVVVPVFNASCKSEGDPCTSPGYQPKEAYKVSGYAVMNIIDISTFSNTPTITVQSIRCFACDSPEPLGSRTMLVE